MARHRPRSHRRNPDDLNEQELAMLEEIMEDEFTDAQYDKLVNAIEFVGYTTTALHIISLWLTEMGDVDGGLIFRRFVDEFAKHEAKTV